VRVPLETKCSKAVPLEITPTYFLFRLVDQRVHGMHSRHTKLEQLSLFHDLPNPTIEQLVERINSAVVPGEDVTWNLSDMEWIHVTTTAERLLFIGLS